MIEEKIVAFVEPSFYGIDFVERTHRKGCKVIAIGSSIDNPKKYGYENYYHDFLVADIRSVESIYNAIKESSYYGQIDALIPATDYASHLTAEVAERLSLKTISSQAANNARNKDLARDVYEQHKVPSAKYQKVSSLTEAIQAAKRIAYPVVLKPTNCASSQGVYFIENDKQLEVAFEKLREFKKTYMDFDVRNEYLIEEYLIGPEFSVEFFLKDNEVVFSSVTEKLTSDLPYFVEISHTVPTSVENDKIDDMIRVCVQALRAIGIDNGPSHVELKLTKDGPKIIEVNGRPGGDKISSELLHTTYGLDIFDETVNFYLDLPITETHLQKKATSIAYLTADREGIISFIEGEEDIANDLSILKYDITVKTGDKVKVPESSDDRLGYVITTGQNPEEAKHNAINLINRIKLQYH
ncbi:ATP-grasp domain-containing protein (plasmid) [Pseudalkalibacillus hwajinpoensis]|uniref:ATP-grasp domain-containing protein n=1 Tax=Guptibacillus hwajinpoensis TaxID=208199 RepID=UPI00325AA09E